jgi:hypothetical protein
MTEQQEQVKQEQPLSEWARQMLMNRVAQLAKPPVPTSNPTWPF